MELNDMTGDPNQKCPPSIFRFDSYPGPSVGPFQWSSMSQSPKRHTLSPRSGHSPSYSRFPGQDESMPPHTSQFTFGVPTLQGQFPFQTGGPGSGAKSFKYALGKRKTDSPPLQRRKQLITEEKMAEHMSNLHISSETETSPLEPESVRNKRLYMCEEMRKLQNDPIIPASFMSHMQRPCTALVLWQPPLRIVPYSDLDVDGSKEDMNSNTAEMRSMEAAEIDSENSSTMDMDA